MSTTNKPINYTENDRAIVTAFKSTDKAELTGAELSELAGRPILPGHLVSAMKKNLIAKAGDTTIMKSAKRAVYTYSLATANPTMKADGKPNTYNENELAILMAAANFDREFILADLNEALGKTVAPSYLTNLVRKGNFTKGDKIMVATMKKTTVNTYSLCGDIAE